MNGAVIMRMIIKQKEYDLSHEQDWTEQHKVAFKQ